ncbi:unnamed protein product [Hymenolepis diminuta]|uniref:Protein kinase domain-containing protein n=1 Tax=Hymenolepis diminuta TaxID=6216 RepID=A0A564YRH2_HYMDI|nr:unnamed protein product [Hymenolepis diminuta]
MSATTSSVSAQPVDTSNTLNGLPSSVRPQQTPSSGGGEEETSTSTAAAPDETTVSEEARVGSRTKGLVPQGGGETLATGGGSSGAAEKRAAVGDTPASVPPPAKRAWRDQPHVGKYKLIRTLGSGNFAKVKLAQHITTKKEIEQFKIGFLCAFDRMAGQPVPALCKGFCVFKTSLSPWRVYKFSP